MAAAFEGRVTACLIVPAGEIASRPADALTFEFAGVVGDRHSGMTRPSTSREPWYPRGTIIRNDRQISLVSVEETEAVGAAMALPLLEPAWIGANIVVQGIPDFSVLPPGTRLFFRGGVTLHVEAANGPCRIAGASIARNVPGREGLDLLFPQVAKGRRGLVASVEKPGVVSLGEGVAVDFSLVRKSTPVPAAPQGTLL